MKLKKLKIPKDDQRYLLYRKINTVKDLVTYPKIDNDIKKYKAKGMYSHIVNIVESLKKDNANQIRRASYALFLWLKHDIVRLAQHQNEDNINYSIKDKYGIFLPNTVRYFLKKGLENHHIIDCGVVNNQHEFIGTIKGYIETLPLPQYQEKLRKYLIEGKTTRDLAKEYNISFQAISVQLKRVLPVNEYLFENQFAILFTKTNISQEEFYKLFPEAFNDTYFIIKNMLRGKNEKDKNRLSIYSHMNDTSIPFSIRQRIINLYQKDNLVELQNGDIIKTQNISIMKYILVKYYSDKLFTKNDLLEKYNEIIKYLLEEKKINIKPYSLKSNYINTFLLNKPYILLNKNNQFRYVDTNKIDCNKVLSLCNLSQFKDVAISTKIIFNQHPEEFKSLNLNNYYELYFYLKKKVKNHKNISFVRVPHINFGKGNLISQIKRMKLENPSWSKSQLAREIELNYGFDKNTISANYLAKNEV